MYLLVDIGNTRAKWALGDGSSLRSHAAAGHDEFAAAMRSYLIEHSASITATLVANVAGPLLEQALTAAVREYLDRDPQYLTSSREICGVRNAYRVPERLGVDRWVAMIGARHSIAGPLCVVSVGTAMTIDVLDATTQHLGGLIVPGPQLLISSLLTNTSDIAPRAQLGERDHELLAIDTLGAITQGAEQMLVALVERVTSVVEARLGAPLTLVLTGGASDSIRPLLRDPVVFVPDLTLRGLASIARHVQGKDP
ncbi:MAG: type III pantothenate kinase [Steroidobacteraceae bacterium]